MTEPRRKRIATVGDAEEMQRALSLRAAMMGRSREQLDAIAGLPDGNAAALLCVPPQKRMSVETMFWLASALGMAVVFVEDPKAMERLERHPRCQQKYARKGNHWRNAKALSIIAEMAQKNGKLGADARMVKMSPEQRSRVARKGAKARWRKPSRLAAGSKAVPRGAAPGIRHGRSECTDGSKVPL
jgi:hypothetical protein